MKSEHHSQFHTATNKLINDDKRITEETPDE